MAERRSTSGASVAALVALWAVVVAGALLGSGCYGRNCEGDNFTYGQNEGEGRLAGPDLWESGPVDGEWLPFPKQRLLKFDLRRTLGNRTPTLIVPYVSAQQNPFKDGANFVPGAGNIVEIFFATDGQVIVHNGTCADYYIRLVVQAPPLAPQPADPNANANEDATDAGTD